MHNYIQMNPTLTQTTILNTFIKSDISTQPLTLPENHIKIFKIKNWMLSLKPPYNIVHFINILPSQKICTFRDMDPFPYQHHIFSAFPNLNYLTSGTQKFKLYKFLPQALSQSQIEPKQPERSWIDPHLDHETAVHILLEDPA